MWWSKRVSSSTEGDDFQKTADVLAECAHQFRLEPLEPRLLLSADPISAELARVVQEDALQNNADAVAAIIQEADSTAETNAADNGQDEFLVKWPETWALSGDDTRSGQFDLRSIVAELVDAARQAMLTGGGLEGLVVGINAGDEAGAEASQSASDSNAAGETSPESGDADNSLTQTLLDEALADALQGADGTPFGNLGIQLADLEGDLVAEIRGGTLFVDVDAAGNGWDVDPAFPAHLAEAADAEPQGSEDSQASDKQVAGGRPAAENTRTNEPGPDQSTADDELSSGTASEAETPEVEGQFDTASGQADAVNADEEQQSALPDNGFYSLDIAGSEGETSAQTGSSRVGFVEPDQGAFAADGAESDKGTELVIGYVAGALRLAESNRSSRNESNRLNGKEDTNKSSDSSRVSPLSDSNISTSVDKGNESDARAPPVNQALTTNFEDESSDSTSDAPRCSS